MLAPSAVSYHFPDLLSAMKNPIFLSKKIEGMVNSYMTFLLMSILDQQIDSWMGGREDDLVFCFKVEFRATYSSTYSQLSFI